jgi:hypothetical protein
MGLDNFLGQPGCDPVISPLRSNANIVSWLLTDNVVTTQAYRLASIAGKWPVPPYRKMVRR